MNRREFLGGLALGIVADPAPARAEPFPVRFRKANPYESYIPLIDPGHDEFTCEEEASRLKALLARHDPDSRYYVLSGNVVRYEKKSENSGRLEYRVGYSRVDWEQGRIRSIERISETIAHAEKPLFREITSELLLGTPSFRDQMLRGVPYWRGRLDSASGIDIYGSNGIAVGDIDNDGWDEVYVCQPGGLPNRLYKRRADGTMEDITYRAGVGVLDDTASALFLDTRNSGRQDLLVLRGAGPILFLNGGDGTFEDYPGAFRFRTAPQGGFTGMAAADYDRDGKLDLYLCCYVYFQSEDQYRYPAPYHDARNGPPNFLFRNRMNVEGTGYFEDVTAESGMSENNDRYSFAPAWCDYDGDGWPDLYVANDFGRNNLYKNNNGRFRDVALAAGVEDIGPGMSAAWFDYDGDGRPDLYVSNMWSESGQRIVASKEFAPAQHHLRDAWHRHTKGNSLYRNRGDGKFDDTGDRQGVEMGRWAWSSDGHDFDNDGRPEIFVTCGMITNAPKKDLMSFFWRQVVAKSPWDATVSEHYENGWNALNQFIREDHSWNGQEPNVFYVRQGDIYVDYSGVSGLDFAGDSRAFAVTDLDGDGNLDLIVKSRLGPQIRVFENNCALGRKAIAFRLTGTKSNRDAIGARVEVDGQVKFVNAGSGFLSQHTKVLHFGLRDANAARQVRITWPSGLQQELNSLPARYRYDLIEGESHPKRTAFLARVERSSEAPLVPDNEPKLETAWFLEPVPLPEKRTGPGLLRLAEFELRDKPDLARQYALFRRYLFEWRASLDLPLTLLLDGQGRAVKIYGAPPPREMVERDLAILDGNRYRSLALPFPGRYFTPPQRNYYRLGGAFYLAGYPEQSIVYFEEVLRQNASNEKALTALGQIHLSAGRVEKARSYLDRAVLVNPRSFEAWSNLGGVEFTTGNARAALEHYHRAIQLRPASALALVNAGHAHAKLGDLPSAEALFKKAAQIDANDPEPLTQLGLLAAGQGRNDDARRYFQQAITVRRDYSGAINNLGVVYLQMGQRDDAIAVFEYGINEAPDEDILYLNLGRTYVAKGERDRARGVMRRWLDRKPQSPAARKALRDLEGQ